MMSGLASPVRTTCFPLFIIPAHSASEDACECADVAGVHVASLDPAIACRFSISSCAWLIGLQLRQHRTSQSKNAKAISQMSVGSVGTTRPGLRRLLQASGAAELGAVFPASDTEPGRGFFSNGAP